MFIPTWKVNPRDNHSDLSWIFAHGREVLEKRYSASVQALGDSLAPKFCVVLRGQPTTTAHNTFCLLYIAFDYLIKGDKAGWLKLVRHRDRD